MKPLVNQDSLVEERRRALFETLARDGRIVASSAAEQFGVSEDSIRRDLRHFDQLGLVQRVRGGAVRRVPSSSATERLMHGSDEQVACARVLADRLQTQGASLLSTAVPRRSGSPSTSQRETASPS